MIDNLDEYLGSTLLERSLTDFYTRNKIDFPKADMFRNFTLFLNSKIQKSYIGDDYMEREDQINHFKWVWDTTCDEFKALGFDFSTNAELYIYLKNLFFDLFYDITEKEEQFNKDFFKNISVVIEGIFNYTVLKNTESLYIFLDIYNIFNNGK